MRCWFIVLLLQLQRDRITTQQDHQRARKSARQCSHGRQLCVDHATRHRSGHRTGIIGVDIEQTSDINDIAGDHC